MKKYMTVKEFMEVIPISKPHVYRLITNNEIPHLKFGRKVVIHPDALAMGMPIAGLENNPLITELDKRMSDIEKNITEISNMLNALKSLAEIVEGDIDGE